MNVRDVATRKPCHISDKLKQLSRIDALKYYLNLTPFSTNPTGAYMLTDNI
jgi:hypothetical protein